MKLHQRIRMAPPRYRLMGSRLAVHLREQQVGRHELVQDVIARRSTRLALDLDQAAGDAGLKASTLVKRLFG
ncbi:hypothetical protein [Streptomyces alanosinicus]|uniref:Uncharacterized protein n=1 Tax=Streptomyces alanosinicus TaxID=68171 RepID=A0A918YTL2_9ACTN|nr:hypothetical protein [Streptomyces alanosinicus]GHE15529.1 hypothetical protein GCM10010339_90480 [Streptomyces alanosinicus]